ncbi:MAG: copper-transporting ATPase [Pirellulaceae bacterium]|nr:MAG: copper-transporting ATPase [Pirellulaceae bacterium]
MTNPAGTATGSQCAYCGLPLAGKSTSAGEPGYCCFGCQLAHAILQESADSTTPQRTVTRLGFAMFFALNVMLFAMVLWSADPGPPQTPLPADNAFYSMLRWLCMLLATPVLLLLSGPIVHSAWRSLQEGRMGAELLVVVGSAAAYGHSAWNVVRDQGHVYFEVAVMVLVAFTLGKWLEANGRVQSSRLVNSLARLIPERICRIRGNTEEFVSIAEVAVGDLIRVRPGERLVVDGVVFRGQALLDQRLVTGELQPQAVQPGQSVKGGAVNLDGDLWIRVMEPRSRWSLFQLVEAVRNAASHKSRYQRLADRISQVFMPAVILVACVSGVWWGYYRSVEQGVSAALAVLLIACPCALGLATPMALSVAMAAAARRGICFRNGDSLARLASTRVVAFDKTGTLTAGHPVVTRLAAGGVPGDLLVSVVEHVARCTNHPAAEAVGRWAATTPARPLPIHSAHTVAGCGVVVDLDAAPFRVWMGSSKWLVEEGLELPSALQVEVQRANSEGQAITAVGWEGQVQAVFAWDEPVRTEAAAAIRALQAMGYRMAILTGDSWQRARRAAELLPGVEHVYAELTPDAKVKRLVSLQQQLGPVVMVGDGINDAPGLAASDVGVALGGGLELARQSAEVCLVRDDLMDLVWAIQLSRRTCRTIRRNLLWAFSYNSLGIALAAAGQLHPVLAAVLMLLSSTMVVGQSLRLSRDIDAAQPNPEIQGQGFSQEAFQNGTVSPKPASQGAGV